MDSALKQRLIGAAVLVALAMIFLPMVLKGPDLSMQDAAQVPLDAPAAPDQPFQTREVPLTLPAAGAPEGGVLGTTPAPGDPDAVVTVEPDGAAPRVDFDPAAPTEGDGTLAAIDPATGEAVGPDPVIEPAPATATPEPAAAGPLPVTTASGRYAVNVGSFSNLDNAKALADRLRAQGLPVSSESVDIGGKPALRLRVGPYAERTLAEAARLRVEGVAGGSASIVALDGSAVAPVAATPKPAVAVPAPALAPVPAAPAPRPAAAAGVGYAVQLGALSSEADANVLVGRAKSAGFVAFHQRVNTDRGAVWRVRIGPEADREAAERLRDSVAGKLGLADAIVVSHP